MLKLLKISDFNNFDAAYSNLSNLTLWKMRKKYRNMVKPLRI